MNDATPLLPTVLLTGAVTVPFIASNVTVYPSLKSTVHSVGKFTVVNLILPRSASQYPTLPFVHVTVFGRYGSLLDGKLSKTCPFSVAEVNMKSPVSTNLNGFVIVPDPFTFTSLFKYTTGLKLLVVLASVIFPFVIFLIEELSIT